MIYILAILMYSSLISVDVVLAIRWYETRSIRKCAFAIFLNLFSVTMIVMLRLYRLSDNIQFYFDKPYQFTSIVIMVCVNVYCYYTIIHDHIERRQIITKSSIKEAISNINCGLCYAEQDGNIVLINRCMSDLSKRMFGKNYINAQGLWNSIITFGENNGIKRIDFSAGPAFLFPDKTVWGFERSFLRDSDRRYMEIVARNLTELYERIQELEKDNKTLSEVQDRLAVSLMNIAQSRQEEELLAYKMRIHDQLGNSIIRTRHLLQQGVIAEHDRDRVLIVWQNTVAAFLKNQLQGESHLAGSLKDTKKTAATLGCTIEDTGVLPTDSDVFDRLVRETMYNAIKHASATVLYVNGSESDGMYHIHISDNGEKRSGTVHEGGGLSSLRHAVESQGGSFEIKYENGLELFIQIPKN